MIGTACAGRGCHESQRQNSSRSSPPGPPTTWAGPRAASTAWVRADFDESAVFASFSALRSLAGGACFLGCDQLHRLARAAELAIHAILAHRPPGTPACRQIMARTLTRLEELIVELSQGRQPEGGDEALLSQLDVVIATAPLAASDYRPSTAAVEVPALAEAEAEPPRQSQVRRRRWSRASVATAWRSSRCWPGCSRWRWATWGR